MDPNGVHGKVGDIVRSHIGASGLSGRCRLLTLTLTLAFNQPEARLLPSPPLLRGDKECSSVGGLAIMIFVCA